MSNENKLRYEKHYVLAKCLLYGILGLKPDWGVNQ